jgi:hypothetical protein
MIQPIVARCPVCKLDGVLCCSVCGKCGECDNHSFCEDESKKEE